MKAKYITAGLISGALTFNCIAFTSLMEDNKQLNSSLREVRTKNETLVKKSKEKDNKIYKLENSNMVLKKTNSELLKEKKDLEDKLKECPTQFVEDEGTPVRITMTFYGDSAGENGGYAGISALGTKLVDGTVASNVYPMGTQFTYKGKTYTVGDRGGSNFDNPHRLDVFVPRLSGEDNDSYNKRISGLGAQTVTMYKR